MRAQAVTSPEDDVVGGFVAVVCIMRTMIPELTAGDRESRCFPHVERYRIRSKELSELFNGRD
jgi:hypothetical protein